MTKSIWIIAVQESNENSERLSGIQMNTNEFIYIYLYLFLFIFIRIYRNEKNMN